LRLGRAEIAELLLRMGELAGPAQVDLVGLEGRARFTGERLRVLYWGNGLNRGFLSGLFLDRPAGVRLERHSTPLSASRSVRARESQFDVVIGELPALWARIVSAPAPICVPAWVRQSVRLRSGATWAPLKVMSEVRRHIRRHDYSVEFDSSVVDLRRYYLDYYYPYVTTRFADEAIVVPEDRFMHRARGLTLAKLYRRGDWIAGMLLHREAHCVRFGWFGAVECPPPPGASEVLDSACIEFARRANVREVVLGSARPSLADGVVRYKRRLGAEFTPTRLPPVSLYVSVRRGSEPALHCLIRQPLLRFVGGKAAVYRIQGNDGGIRLENLEPRGVAADGID
jgi:hypothetical protein